MSKLNLQDSFIEFCKKNSFEKNNHQIEIVNLLDQFLHPKKTLFKDFFINKNKFCFYLHGNVGVGKTMILNYIYDQLKIWFYVSDQIQLTQQQSNLMKPQKLKNVVV